MRGPLTMPPREADTAPERAQTRGKQTMTTDTDGPRVSLHRFHDCAAIAITGTGGGTVYLDSKAARQLARDMARLCRSIERERFRDSAYRQDSVAASFHVK